MNRLFYKDLVSAKLLLVATAAGAIIYSTVIQSGPYIPFVYSAFLGCTVMAATIDIDRTNGWMRFLLFSGIDRNDIVNSKYMVSWVTTASSLIAASVAAVIIVAFMNEEFILEDAIPFIVLGIAINQCLNSLMMLLAYRFSKTYTIVILLAMILGVTLLIIKARDIFGDVVIPDYAPYAVSVALIGSSLLFYYLTRKVVGKMEI